MRLVEESAACKQAYERIFHPHEAHTFALKRDHGWRAPDLHRPHQLRFPLTLATCAASKVERYGLTRGLFSHAICESGIREVYSGNHPLKLWVATKDIELRCRGQKDQVSRSFLISLFQHGNRLTAIAQCNIDASNSIRGDIDLPSIVFQLFQNLLSLLFPPFKGKGKCCPCKKVRPIF